MRDLERVDHTLSHVGRSSRLLRGDRFTFPAPTSHVKDLPLDVFFGPQQGNRWCQLSSRTLTPCVFLTRVLRSGGYVYMVLPRTNKSHLWKRGLSVTPYAQTGGPLQDDPPTCIAPMTEVHLPREGASPVCRSPEVQVPPGSERRSGVPDIK